MTSARPRRRWTPDLPKSAGWSAIAGLSTPGSDIRRLNATGRLENPDPALLDMLAVADDMHHATGGAFDVTVQPLWIFYDSFAKRGAWPTDEEAAPARKLIGQKFVRLRRRRDCFERPGMGITLNSLTHGYAADRVAKILAERGVQTGVCRYRRNGGIGPQRQGPRLDGGGQAPRVADAMLGTAPLTGCMATAGDYAYTWSEDYSRHHILDPRTGYSPASFACVSVIAEPRGAWPTRSLPPFRWSARKRARSCCRRFRAEAYGVTKSGEVWATPGFPRQNLA